MSTSSSKSDNSSFAEDDAVEFEFTVGETGSGFWDGEIPLDLNGPQPDDEPPTIGITPQGDGDDALDFDEENTGEGSGSNSTLSLPKVLGSYEILRPLGAGGMGRVFLARHHQMGRLVALKTLAPDLLRVDSAIQRFYAEIRATAQLMHPNIVTAFDAGETAGVHYLAMEYVEGQTLSQLVRQHGPMPLGDAISAIIDAAKGLAYAHRNGIVHRDVKPSNFIRTPEGIVKVLDLGLATIGKSREHHPEMQGKLVGTIEYMAPEQLQNAAVSDNRSDIYSLGATLYFLLTGRTPYTGEMLELAKAHRQLPPPDLFTARPDIDVRVNQVFRRMMATHVQQRYANMDELLEDLQAWEQRGAAPQWIADMGSTSGSETPTTGGYSTLSATLDVLGIDFGMQYAAAGRASPDGTINALSAGPEKRALKRLAVYGRPTNVVTGSEALKHRELKPHRVAHCLPLFVGSETVNRKITNRLCPPEALMGLILRRIANNAIDSQPQPGIVAITVPSMYNQFHRRSILQAAKLAGFESVRLVHRSVAAAQFQLLTEHALHQHDRDDDVVALDDPKDTAGGATDSADDSSHHKLVVCITGMGTEISVVHATTNRVTQLSAVGNVHGGTLRWTQSLVDFVAKSVSKEFSVDLRADTGDAIHLQIACEKAMAQLMIGEQTTLRLQSKTHGDRMRLMISRKDLLECGEGLLVHLNEMIARAVKDAGIKMSDIKQCLTVGMTIRIPEVSQRLLSQLPADVELIPIERNELAVGAASCVVAEFPDRQGLPLPPQPCMGMAIGLLAKNADGQRRIQELITKGSELPAHVNRRLTSEKDGKSPTLRIVESHGWRKTQWTQIGQHQLPALDGSQTLETSIDADINGMLVLRCRRADGAEVTQLPVLNTSPLPDDSLATWAAWVKKYA